MSHPVLSRIDELIRRDPARRGPIGSEAEFGPLGVGELEAAASHLAAHATHVAIVTGFFIPGADPPAAETDGPPGAVVLARALRALDVEVTLLTDVHCRGAVEVAVRAAGLDQVRLIPFADAEPATVSEFFRGVGRTLSHLIAIERVGPSHTLQSFRAQVRPNLADCDRFESLSPCAGWDCCHNMRAEVIDAHTCPLHRLFEELPRHLPAARSIGIGDGGNEIGMGRFAWEDLVRRLGNDQVARIPCRVATDWTIIAGTSNWGGYALAASVLLLRDRVDVLAPWDRRHELRVLEAMVEDGPAVDGVTRRREPTVDGLPFITYIQAWEGIRRLLGVELGRRSGAPR